MSNLSSEEKKILAFLEGDLPLTESPFREIAGELQVSEEKVVGIVKRLLDRGILRRVGAVIRHRKAGYSANAMVVWRLGGEMVDSVEEIIKKYPQVTHAYFRRIYPGKWEYNFYTMIHGKSDEELGLLIRSLADDLRCDDFRILRTVKELKKTSPVYLKRGKEDYEKNRKI